MARPGPGRSNRGIRGQYGFAVTQLAVTIVILGVLVSMVVTTTEVTRAKAQQAACKGILKVISNSIAQYQAVHSGDNPPDLNRLVTDGFLPNSFKWTCPSGDFGAQTGDYRHYYDSTTGETSCPRKNHNP
jgi:competence protein ComGC